MEFRRTHSVNWQRSSHRIEYVKRFFACRKIFGQLLLPFLGDLPFGQRSTPIRL